MKSLMEEARALGVGPSSLSPDDLAHHQYVMARLQRAQVAAEEWAAYVAGKYALPEGTQITDAGAFVAPEPRLTAILTGDD